MQTTNKPKQTRRKFDQEFKTEALRMVSEGQLACAVARSLNVSEKLIYRWKDQQKNQLGKERGVANIPYECVPLPHIPYQGFLIKPEQALQVYTVCILCSLGALLVVSKQTGKLTEQH